MTQSSRPSLAADWTRRAVLQTGVGLATYAAWPRSVFAAQANPTNVCIDYPITHDRMSNAQIRAKSPAAAALHGIDLTQEVARSPRALAAPTDPVRPPDQAAFLNSWEINTLNVFFMGGSATMQATVMKQVQKWTAACNINFVQTDRAADSHVRVNFTRGLGHFSHVGVECRSVPVNQQTMNLDMTEASMLGDYNMSVILHEFGHAIGLLHEHSSPASNLRFADMASLIRFFRGKFGEGLNNPAETQRLIEHNILKKYRDTEVKKFSQFDPDSIMIYALPPEVLAPGSGAMRANLSLSATDTDYARRLYGDPIGGSGGGGGGGGGAENRRPPNPTQFTAGSDAVEAYLNAGSTVELKLVVPRDQADRELAIYTTGTTRVMLTLYNSGGSEIKLGEKTEHGSPDFMNEVMKTKLAAGDYKVTIKHPSSRGGGYFKIQAHTKGMDKYLFKPNQSQ